jgi:SNF2 family DNA or RNA helicase
MGLGKTPTAIALLASSASLNSPHLVVCPTTLLANWLRELERFCPSLRRFLHYGSQRLLRSQDFLSHDVIVTSYGTLRSDLSLLTQIPWNIVIADEAQKLKNPASGISEACRRLKTRCSIAVTGTPFENRPMDLWTLMDFVEPGFLGTREDFKYAYGDPVMAGDQSALKELESHVRLFMLRRLKREVRDDLPEKIEIEHPLIMTASEAAGYRSLLEKTRQSVSQRGIRASALTALRQFCCHLHILDSSREVDPLHDCSKYQLLVNILQEIFAAQEKVIIFSSFLRMLDLLQTDLTARFSFPVLRIDGSVPAGRRQPIVDDFSNNAGSAVLLLNPNAAGLGLNIVAANHVIHYNREWNPAVEDQATDRTYRDGQHRNVMVHYLFYIQSVEQVIADRLVEKRQTARELVRPSEDKDADRRALLAALNMVPSISIEGNESNESSD